MDDEVKATPAISLGEIKLADISSQPVTIAESLAHTVSALSFDHRFLFHAYKAMLYPPKIPFETRVGKLRQWWIDNSAPRSIKVVFRTRSGGASPKKGSAMALERWETLPESIQQCARKCEPWWLSHQGLADTNGYFMAVVVEANSPDGAESLALERYADYRRYLPIRAKPIEIDDEWSFVDDSHQKPSSKTYALHQDKYHFRVRHYDAPTVHLVSKAAAHDLSLSDFWKHYQAASDDVARDKPDSALDNIAKALDKTFEGYQPVGKKWKGPRVFVEAASIVESLYWLGTQYRYILEYTLKPSWTIGGKNIFGDDERRPEKILARIVEDRQWLSAIAGSDWDELLKFRRRQFVAELASLPSVLADRRKRSRWDLARAVRARNSLFHRGEPLQDQYLLAVFLSGFDLALRLRIGASQVGKPFATMVGDAARQYDEICTGVSKPAPEQFVTLGWL